MRMIFMILLIIFAVGLSGCTTNNSNECLAHFEGETLALEWTWNEDDGFVQFKVDGINASDEAVIELNDAIENSEFSTVSEFMDDFKVNAENEGYVCD